MYASILAGGSGTRLWPLSTQQTPKQFLRLMSDQTMLQETVERVAPFVASDQVYVVTFAQYRQAVAEQLPALPVDHILAEPVGRGTAASIGLAATLIAAREPTAIMGSFHADAAIADVAGFRHALAFAEQVAREGYLVTLGCTPTYAETGYGYIQAGAPLATWQGLDAYHVSRFVEKPQRAVAEEYLRAGKYSWNSGIFVWRVDRILEEMRRYVPQVASVLDEIGAAAQQTGGRMTADVEHVMQRAWPRLTENVTIDVGIMERADRIAVIPVSVGWNDIGSWAQVATLHPRNDAGNTVVGLSPEQHLSVQTSDTLIFSTTGRKIATAGVEGLVIVDTPEGVLVCAKEQVQLVKDLAEQAKQAQQKPES
ncbi:MAG TPA: sugar phosphate nucleotidyltransferase [Ktedonobacterales bacterium]